MNKWNGEEREQVLMWIRKQLARSNRTPTAETEEMWNQDDGCNVNDTETPRDEKGFHPSEFGGKQNELDEAFE